MDVTWKEHHEKILRRSCVKTDGDTWLSYDPVEAEMT
jgi:hypothetical protein